jgi:hypothetical protein
MNPQSILPALVLASVFVLSLGSQEPPADMIGNFGVGDSPQAREFI